VIEQSGAELSPELAKGAGYKDDSATKVKKAHGTFPFASRRMREASWPNSPDPTPMPVCGRHSGPFETTWRQDIELGAKFKAFNRPRSIETPYDDPCSSPFGIIPGAGKIARLISSLVDLHEDLRRLN
jgi:hypothetical protein